MNHYRVDRSELNSAAATLHAIAVELDDMLMRLPRFDADDLRRNHPTELLNAWRDACRLRSALLDLEQSVREASHV